jgi:hypothetical protein
MCSKRHVSKRQRRMLLMTLAHDEKHMNCNFVSDAGPKGSHDHVIQIQIQTTIFRGMIQQQQHCFC